MCGRYGELPEFREFRLAMESIHKNIEIVADELFESQLAMQSAKDALLLAKIAKMLQGRRRTQDDLRLED